MTDARPEPDKIDVEKPDVDPTVGVRPELVWARPTSPDPWGNPGGAGPSVDASEKPASEPEVPVVQNPVVQTPVSEASRSEGRADETPAKVDDATVDNAPLGAAPAPAGEAAEEPSADQEPSSEVTRPVEAPEAPLAPLPEYQPPPPPAGYPQFATPQYAGPQYTSPDYAAPQYTAPQGFGSPQGLDPAPAPTQATPFGPYGVDVLLPDQANQTAQPGEPGQTGQPGGMGQSDPAAAPWYADASAPPTQQSGGTGWPPQPYSVDEAGGRKRGRTALIALLVGACLLVGALGGVAGSELHDNLTDASGRNPTISLPEPKPVDVNRATSAVTTVAAAVLPSVVSINVQAGEEAGTGSGFVIDAEQGYILTNNHVVTAGGTAAATSIKVIFQDGTEAPGKVVGLDASYDLAVIKVTAKGLRQLQLGDSDSVRVGDPVVAIGAPLGLQGTVTTGIVSALNRPVAAGEGNKPAFINAIQTDAAINPGNSGGPLVDIAGNVIAVNSAIARSPGALGSSSGNIGLGFAIPSNQARRTAEQLIRTGKASHPIIGVSLDVAYTGRGVKVSEQNGENGVKPVTVDGPADQAGIKAGDVILKIDGRPVTEPDELIVAIRAQTPGETITLTVLRGKSESQVRVKLSEATD